MTRTTYDLVLVSPADIGLHEQKSNYLDYTFQVVIRAGRPFGLDSVRAAEVLSKVIDEDTEGSDYFIAGTIHRGDDRWDGLAYRNAQGSGSGKEVRLVDHWNHELLPTDKIIYALPERYD